MPEPTDSERDRAWIVALTSRLSDQHYDRLQTSMQDLIESGRVADALKDSGDVRYRDPDHEAINKGLRPYAASGEESLLQRYFQICLKQAHLLGPEQVADLYMAQIPVASLNGCTARSPSGRPVILLNHGLIAYVAKSIHLVLALTGFADGDRYCRHHSDEEFFIGLFRLGSGLRDREPALTMRVPGTECLGSPAHADSDMLHEGLCVQLEMFLMLHELAHVSLGHLHPDRTSRREFQTRSGTRADVQVFDRTRQDELDADLAAARALIQFAGPADGADTDCLFAIGVLFVVLRVMELDPDGEVSATHPSAYERWANVRQARTSPAGPRMMDSIDALFDFFDDAERPSGHPLG
jgi:hypothetical protein